MPILYDRKGQPVDVPDEQVAKAVASGQYAYAKGQSVTMKGPAGEVLEGPAEQVAEMLRRGFSIESTPEKEERELQEEYGGPVGQAAAIAHGAVKALTFGMGDEAIAAIGGKKAVEYVKNVDKANPNDVLVGELGTLLGTFLVPGAQAGAIGKLTQLPTKVAKIGRKVEGAVLKGLGGAKGGLVRQALAKGTALGTGAGVEGALYGGGQFISEQALGETEATAENLLGHMKMGAMWGAGAGGAMGVGGELLKRGLGAGANFAKRSSKSVVKMWENATGNKAVDGLADAVEEAIANPKVGPLSKTAGTLINEPIENVARLSQKGEVGKEIRRLAQKNTAVRESFVTNISDDLDLVDNLVEGATDQMKGRMKIKNMGSIKTLKMGREAAVEGSEIITGIKKYADDLVGMKDEAGYVYKRGARSALKDVQSKGLHYEKEIKKLLDRADDLGDDLGAEIHGVMDSAKRDLGKRISKLERVRNPDSLEQKILAELKDKYTVLQRHCENIDLYGAIGKFQGTYNPVWSRVIGRDKGKFFRSLHEKVGESAWRPEFATNRGAVENFVNDLGRARNKTAEGAFLSQLDDKLELVRLTRDGFDNLPAGLTKNLDEAEKIVNRIKGQYKEATKVVGLQNQLGDIVQKSNALQSILPMGAGAGVGYLLGGEEGMALGLGLSVFTNPGRIIQMRAALERLSSGSELSIVKSIKKYISQATGKTKPVARKMLAPTSLKILQGSNWGDKRTKDKTRQEAFKRRSDELTEFLTNPQKAMDRVNKKVAAVDDVAPNIATAMKIKAVKGARYLYDKAPKPPSRSALISGKWKPSDHELAKFERIASVVDGGAEVIMKNLENGILTVPEVEAFQENWPRQYEQVVTTLAEQIPELHEKLPYKNQVQLGILFGVPVHPTMEPDFRKAVAAIDMIPPVAPGELPGPKQPKSKVGNYQDLSIDKASLSGTQRVEMNKIS